MTKKIKTAVVGMGKMGLLHSSILNTFDDVEFIGIADTNKFIVNSFRQIKPDWKYYHNYSDLINDNELDLIFITTPIFSHSEIMKECIKNNLSFFVEKPAVANTSQIDHFSKIKTDSLFNAVGYMMRYVPTFSKGKRLITNSIIGKINSIQAKMYISQLFKAGKGWRYDPHVSGGGVIIHQTCHVIDLLNWYFGVPDKVSSVTKNWYSKDVEDYAHIIMEYGNGVTGWIDSSWSRHNHRMLETQIHIEGNLGTLSINDDKIVLYLTKDSGGYKKGWTEISKMQLPMGTSIDLGAPAYTLQNREFIDVIKNGNSNTKNLHTINDSINLHRIIDSIYLSSKEGSGLIEVK